MDKINVLIVDDEKIVREGLAKFVRWDDYNMSVAAIAENGQQALDVVNQQEIHLIITDIYMPVLDGMQLINEISDRQDPPLVLLISGYSDFKYAQTAIRTSIVQDYILKPLDFDQMDRVLTKVRQKLLKDASSMLFPVLDKDEWKQFSSGSKSSIMKIEDEIIGKIEAGEISQAIIIFEQEITRLNEQNKTHNYIARFCIEIALNTCELILGKAECANLLKQDPVAYCSKLDSYDKMKEYVIDILNKAHMALSKMCDENVSSLIQSVVKFVNENYNDPDITLNMIADNFRVSPGYLSTKFKTEIGTNFTKYLNGLRVKKAKELLKDISLKVYMVSSKVGFEDVRYFSRIFRSYTGYTPTEFQKKIIQYKITEDV